jgi:hypothetical protein
MLELGVTPLEVRINACKYCLIFFCTYETISTLFLDAFRIRVLMEGNRENLQ